LAINKSKNLRANIARNTPHALRAFPLKKIAERIASQSHFFDPINQANAPIQPEPPPQIEFEFFHAQSMQVSPPTRKGFF
jgi:hypothetical protein